MSAGQCYYELGQYEEALSHYDIAQAKEEKNEKNEKNELKHQISYHKGLANASLGRYQDAIEDYEESTKGQDASKQPPAKF